MLLLKAFDLRRSKHAIRKRCDDASTARDFSQTSHFRLLSKPTQVARTVDFAS
jgi:hypothetical protein